MKKTAFVLALLLFLLTACTVRPPKSSPPTLPTAEEEAPPPQPDPSHVEGLVQELAGGLGLYESTPDEAVKTSFDYLVMNIYMRDPVGLDVWRYLPNDTPLTYLENRALSPLLFAIGSCEDFAALQVLLLREAGLPCNYVAGYTLSKEGVFVDHAWAVVQLNGFWYHLDPQLEHNISLGGQLNYQYYMRTDEELVPSHRWGESLINTFADLTPQEVGAITQHYTPPIGEGPSYPTPPTEFFPPPRVNLLMTDEKIKEIKGTQNLTPVFLNIDPPVLGKNHHITPLLLPDYFPDHLSYEKALKQQPPFVIID